MVSGAEGFLGTFVMSRPWIGFSCGEVLLAEISGMERKGVDHDVRFLNAENKIYSRVLCLFVNDGEKAVTFNTCKEVSL